LADKARLLSLKHGLRDEAQLIELEEMRLMKLLQEEEKRYRSGKEDNMQYKPSRGGANQQNDFSA
jgi:phage antirepressor YoqD-like protein